MRHTLFGAFALLLASMPAHAALIVATGNDNTNTDNVVFNPCAAEVVGPATAVSGCLNSTTSQVVNFTADANVQVNGGQARVEDVAGFSSLAISLAGAVTFDKLVVNINVPNRLTDLTVKFFDGLNTSAAFSLGSGSNFFTITGGPFTSITILSFIGGVADDFIDDVRQVRIGVTQNGGTDVPEPGMGLMLLGGVAGAYLLHRRRRMQAQA